MGETDWGRVDWRKRTEKSPLNKGAYRGVKALYHHPFVSAAAEVPPPLV
jgi:hypothetical protein